MRHYQNVDEALNLFAPTDFIIGDDEPSEFVAPVEVFPIFKKALAFYQDRAPGHAVQIDTPESYEEMIGKGSFTPITGVVPDDADNVKCYHDDDCIFVSILFLMDDGSPRVASSAARPMDEESFEGWGEILGADPVAFLAVLPEASRVATGKRLLRSAAEAVEGARARHDVVGMRRPVLVHGLTDTAPLAALMYLEQRAQGGDTQAIAELAIMQGAAETPLGKKVAAPLLAEASRRLATAQRKRAA